jgi:hypothetical protein
MSLKNRYLLERAGRDQYGEPGTEGPERIISPGRTSTDEAMWALHRDLHDRLVARHGEAWVGLFKGRTKKDSWDFLFGSRGLSPTLGTFRKMASEFASCEEFLLYWLVSEKRHCLSILGIPKAEIDNEMAQYQECGRYYVTFGQSTRLFGTLDNRLC